MHLFNTTAVKAAVVVLTYVSTTLINKWAVKTLMTNKK